MKLEEAENFLSKAYYLFLDGHKAQVTCIKLTNDNKYIASGSADVTIRIWDFIDQ